jgi:hypothetical protein
MAAFLTPHDQRQIEVTAALPSVVGGPGSDIICVSDPTFDGGSYWFVGGSMGSVWYVYQKLSYDLLA